MVKAFHADPALKDEQLKRIQQLAASGMLAKDGVSLVWARPSLEHYFLDQLATARDTGIPLPLLLLHDQIFRELPADEAQLFAEEFVQVIKPGADLSAVRRKYAASLLDDERDGIICFVRKDDSSDDELSGQIRDAALELASMFREGCSDRWRWQKISALTFKLEIKAYKLARAETTQTRPDARASKDQYTRNELVAFAARYLSAAAVDARGETVARDAATHAPAYTVRKSLLLELLRQA